MEERQVKGALVRFYVDPALHVMIYFSLFSNACDDTLKSLYFSFIFTNTYFIFII